MSEALDVAYALELFHNFTLVHDDIMDDADIRRGLPSVYAKYGTNEAILAGDVMLIEVYDRLLHIDTHDQIAMMKAFTQTAREVCEGQSMDMAFETREDVTIAEYLNMIELKTAVLLGLALKLGAMHGGASANDQQHLYKFASNAGIAFQLQDDYLDVYGDPEKFGKKVGGDIIQGKKTYLYLRALDLLEGQPSKDFQKLYASRTDGNNSKVEQVRAVFDELFIPHYCTEVKDAYYALAKSHLDAVSIDDATKEDLLAFAKQLMNREA